MSNEVGSSSQSVHSQKIEDVTVLLDFVKSIHENEKFSPIYDVPSRLRDINPNSFVPRVVSIGPLHKGGANLKIMEDKKMTYLEDLLKEVGSPAETFRNCEKKVSDSIEKIKRCYSGKRVSDFRDDELALMMVMDACFILQFIYKLTKTGNFLSDNRLRSRSVALDLVLLENQIPFFVLQDIYDLTLKTLQPPPKLKTMLLDLLERVNPFAEMLTLENPDEETPYYHILGFLHELYQPNTLNIPKIKAIPTAHTAVGLHKLGVRFRANKNLTWPMAIEFEKSWHTPTLKMPKVLIDNFFEVVMRNLIVYEQYSPVRNYVTSYAMAIDMLAATPADIAKLAESNIIISHLGSNETASNMISSICRDVTFLDFYYIESWKKVKSYTDSYWYKNYGVLKQKYFSTPWKIIALLAGIILFSIAVIQFALRMVDFKKLH